MIIEIHHNDRGWLPAAEMIFEGRDSVEISYDIDYAIEFFGRTDRYAISVKIPVDTQPYRGPIPGFVLDLIPQGQPLKRLLAKYGIRHEDDYDKILGTVPLAPPGNLRIQAPWQRFEIERPNYSHVGFTVADVVQYHTEFVEHMAQIGAPIGGTSGAGGGSLKMLLREDFNGRLHAEGMLDDVRTKSAILVKFPYTDSTNSRDLNRVEKAYHDLARSLPLKLGPPMSIHDDILFIPRFDRIRDPQARLCYHGLESFYSAHGINLHGMQLRHEDNLHMIAAISINQQSDLIEYLKRDIMNRLLANTDNHGRNTSFIKTDAGVELAPLYDLTAMRFFRGDVIVELTRWDETRRTVGTQVTWLSDQFEIPRQQITSQLLMLRQSLGDLETRLRDLGVPAAFIDGAAEDRTRCLNELEAL